LLPDFDEGKYWIMAEVERENSPAGLHVLVVTTSYPIRGGPPSGPFIQRLADNMPPQVKVTILTPCVGAREEYQQPSGSHVTCFRYAPKPWQRLAHVPGGIPVALRSNPLLYLLLPGFLLCLFMACWRASKQVDIIHANWSVNGAVAGIVAGLRGIPLVTTLRGEDVSRAGHSRLFRWLLKQCLKMSRHVITVSRALREQVVEQFPAWAGKVGVIHNGIDRRLLNQELVRGDREVFNIVTVGSLISRKNVATLVRALQRLPDLKAVKLVIVGDGPERKELECLISELGVESSVSFAGPVPPDDVVRYMEAADALVLCSLSEGRPNVVLEAMAVGLAVVATAIQGVTEIIDDGKSGLLFEPTDVAVLADHLEKLRREPDLRLQLATEARSWIRDQNLFWDATGREYHTIYQECIEGRV
jgi:glycosyltransferase involved in cell wall biosynthesis